MSAAEYPVALSDLAGGKHVDEVALISTCNRTEAYAVSKNADAAVVAIQAHIGKRADEIDVSDHLFSYQRDDAIKHLA